MSIQKIFYLFVVLVLTGCSNDPFFADQYTPNYTANPFLYQGTCTPVEAVMLSEKSALIYTGEYALFTEDDFETFSYNKYIDLGPCDPKIGFFDGYNFIGVNNAGPGFSFKDPTASFQSFDYSTLKIQPPINLINNFEELTNSVFESPTSFYFVRKIFVSDGVVHLNLYQADASSKEVVYISTPEILGGYSEFTSLGLYQAGNLLVYLGYEQHNFGTIDYYTLTTKDGLTWTKTYLLTTDSYVTDYVKGISGNNALILVQTDPLNYLLSKDEGKNWENIVLGFSGKVLFTQAIDDKTIFAVIEQNPNGDAGTLSKLAKSFDAGQTWTVEPTLFYGGKISFIDKLNGVATSKGTLQVTHDGGKTWRAILISPYQG